MDIYKCPKSIFREWSWVKKLHILYILSIFLLKESKAPLWENPSPIPVTKINILDLLYMGKFNKFLPGGGGVGDLSIYTLENLIITPFNISNADFIYFI